MSTPPDDARFVEFLRRFQPPAPAPLPHASRRGPGLTRWLLAALVLLAAGIWLHRRVERRLPAPTVAQPAQASTWRALGIAARGDTALLDAQLERQAGRALPDLSRKDGALRLLAEFHKDL